MTGRIIAAALLLHIGATAAIKQVEARWEELGGLVLGKKIALTLPDGASIEGRVASVHADSLTLTIAKTSDAQAYPKRETSISRASVATVKLLEMRIIGRVAGTVIGAVIGVGAVVAIAVGNGILNKPSGGENAGVAVALVGLPVVGFLIGRSLDRKVTLIKIVH
jgi:hypothetical protein